MEGLTQGAQVVTSKEEMLEVAKSFYGDLFRGGEMGKDLAAGFLDVVAGRLPEESIAALEGRFALEEVENAMLSLRTGVASGRDGLPVEFYRTFWPLVVLDLLAVYRKTVECGALPPSDRVGHITLLHKKGDGADLANWRLIMLLTADYKILAKLLVLSLRKVIAKVVHPDQTCGVPRRSCGMKLALIRNTLTWAEQHGAPLALLSLNQEKV